MALISALAVAKYVAQLGPVLRHAGVKSIMALTLCQDPRRENVGFTVDGRAVNPAGLRHVQPAVGGVIFKPVHDRHQALIVELGE